MERNYYFCCCRLDAKDYYFIWVSDEENGAYLNSERKFLVSGDLESLVIYAKNQKLLIKAEKTVFYNLEALEKTLEYQKFEIDCVEFLNIRNLFNDISCSVGENFDSERKATEQIYEKLFWGNNIPAVTPEGKSYKPIWSKKEIKTIRETFLNGTEISRKNLKYVD